MTREKILEVIKIYRDYFEKNSIGKIDFPHNELANSRDSIMMHCHGMLDTMEKLVAEGRIEKAFRWLGFIQGCLWSLGIYPLDDLKNHNRP